MDEASNEEGLFVRQGEKAIDDACVDNQNKLWWDRHANGTVLTHTEGADPYLLGDFELENGMKVKPAFQLLVDRVRDYTPEWASSITGIPVETIKQLAHEMGITARDQKIELPIPWTDT